MILGAITFILSILGVYGFFVDNMVLMYIGFSGTVFEIVIGLVSGQLKSLITVWIALLISFGLMAGGVHWFKAISICLCLENIICFIAGIIMMLWISHVSKEENKMDNENSIFNIKFPHCIFYYAHIHILLPVGIVLNLISSVNSAWCFVLAILQIVELILLIKHHKYSYKAFLISEIYFDILYIILNNKLIPFMVGLGTLKIIYMYKRKYILTHSRVEMQYAPTKKENKNIKKLALSNMVNPYNNKFMLKDKDIAEYILMYNSEDGVCEERQNSKLPQDKIQTSENTWNEYLEKNFTAEGTRTNMQDMLLTNEQHSNAEEYAVKELRK